MANFSYAMTPGSAPYGYGSTVLDADHGWQIGGGDDGAASLDCELPDDYNIYNNCSITATFYAATSVRSSWEGSVALLINEGSIGALSISGDDFSGTGNNVTCSISLNDFYPMWGVSFDPGDTAKLVFYGAEDQFINSSGNCLYLTGGTFKSADAIKFITIKFNANGGSGAPESIEDIEPDGYGEYEFTIPTTEPTRTNYTFLGWHTSSSASTAEYEPGEVVTDITEDDTLYAVWRKNTTYTLTFNYKDNVSDLKHVTVTADVNGVATYDIPSDVPTRDGYVFLGWSTDISGTFAEYEPGDPIEINRSMMLYAVWTQIITINVQKNGVLWADCTYTLELYQNNVKQYPLTNNGTGVYTTQSVDAGTYDLYVSGEKTGIAIRVSDILAFTPVDVNYYTIAYQASTADGGTVPNDVNVYLHGTKATIAHNVGGLTKTDYVFVGWNTSEDGTGTHYNPGDVVSMTAGLSLYAVWREATKAYISTGTDCPPGDPMVFTGETWKSAKMCMYTTEWNS